MSDTTAPAASATPATSASAAAAATGAPATAPPKPGPTPFFYGTATGVVLATAVALGGFLLMNSRTAERLRELQGSVDTMTERAQQWKDKADEYKADYDAATAGDAERLQQFLAVWQTATIPLQRRYLLLAWRPAAGATADYRANWETRYAVERSAWWQELEAQFGPAMPEVIDDPDPAISREFYRLGIWSRAAGEDRDADDALKVALAWAPVAEQTIVHRALGHRIYRVPADIADKATADQIDRLKQFEGQWVTDDNRQLIERFEAEARANQ